METSGARRDAAEGRHPHRVGGHRPGCGVRGNSPAEASSASATERMTDSAAVP